jgi:hypothetical protein
MRHRESGGISLLILKLGARWLVNATSWPLYPKKQAPVPITDEAAWATGPVWKDMEKRKSLAATGIQLRTYQPVASRYTSYAIPVAMLRAMIVITFGGG